MKVLLDTSTFIWFATGAPFLSPRARMVIEESRGQVIVSAVTPWEIAVKLDRGRLSLGAPVSVFYRTMLAELRATELPITAKHGIRAGSLPAIHRDPFDRMLIAQALEEDVPLLTNDRNIARYDVPVVW